MNEAKKKYGQNFLTDKNLLQKIVKDSFLDNKTVIEVGPGRGALTEYICQYAKKVIAFEIDSDLKQYLDKLEQKHENLKITYQDFLKVDLNTIKIKENLDQEVILIGNLPYYITTPILFKFIETPFLKQATIMIQKEVAERISSKPNLKTYNALSVIVQYQAEVKKIMNVSRKLFSPVPKVDSIVLNILKKENIDNAFLNLFTTFVKASFTQKRKTLINNLHDFFNIPKTVIEEFLIKNGFEPNARAEQLSITDFERLTKEWSNLLK
ncbi:16S rRNA (adenine(1518)-N(6)/adenine(1519)-N(6))-dimethyltransferase RsmA [Acholeplasma sp. OttesenSCG-928-E16]|nr:16S rRNA (adenine(1518)-N(6)/adenine(1519)-N(6))-dimethyltransferase RsmA [Acholeplasma sp. OttesenSCG-928-E16]